MLLSPVMENHFIWPCCNSVKPGPLPLPEAQTFGFLASTLNCVSRCATEFARCLGWMTNPCPSLINPFVGVCLRKLLGMDTGHKPNHSDVQIKALDFPPPTFKKHLIFFSLEQ